MKILYMSVHEILEYDECKLFTELGHEVFSLHGAYMNPHGDEGRKRPGIPNMRFSDPHAMEMALQCTREDMHPELIDLFDVIVVMHEPKFIIKNWPRIRHKRVIWRTIGQSIEYTERLMAPYRADGLQIVRYSPSEMAIPGYNGADAFIRFGKDPEVYGPWRGGLEQAICFTQSMRQRGTHCGWQVVEQLARRVPLALYGPGNEGAPFWGGVKSNAEQVELFNTGAAYLAPGTHPASYTLNLMEAWMSGIPTVVFGEKLGSPRRSGYQQDTYEAHRLIQDGVDGMVGDSVEELAYKLSVLMSEPETARRIGDAGRARAIELFGTDKIRADWGRFLG